MRFGIQMYGPNPIFQKDKEVFLKIAAQAGYRYIEPCLVTEENAGLKGHAWTLQELAENMPLLEKYGFSIYSAHAFPVDLDADCPKILEMAKKIGVHQIVMPCPAFASKEDYEALLPALIRGGKAFQAQGLELLMHNGGQVSAARIDGICAYEWLLQAAQGAVFAQPDVGWLLYGGVDPEAFLWRNQGLVRSLHYKDMARTADGMEETAIGSGELDMMACFQFARYAEVIQLADQDGSKGDFLGDLVRVAGCFRTLENGRDNTDSILCIMDTETGSVTELKRFAGIIEAPNWYQQDPDCLFYNADGRIFRYRISTGESTMLESGTCTNCNNDHVISADGKQIAVSHSAVGWASQIYILPIEGGEPCLVTPNAPSYLHGWSPDGTLAYCAFRDHGKGYEVDIYGIHPNGGEEFRLTEHAGFNDGPEYSPDGKHILFISTRSGLMQNWRMNADGSDPVQLTFTDRNNWFGHYSPDGRKIVYLSYSRDGLDPSQHLPNMQVQLSLMNADGSDDHTILDFFGGQGSINVNSWHPDSKRFAFVKYELHHK